MNRLHAKCLRKMIAAAAQHYSPKGGLRRRRDGPKHVRSPVVAAAFPPREAKRRKYHVELPHRHDWESPKRRSQPRRLLERS
jgi:hypothetical protein